MEPAPALANPWTRAAEALLEAGERLLAAEEMQTPEGTTPPPPPDPERHTSPGPLGKAGLAFLSLLNLNEFGPGSNLLDRLLFGVAAAGPAGSLASSLSATLLRTGGIRGRVLVVSDRRLLVGLAPKVDLFSWAEKSHDRLDVVWAAPRTAISAAAIHRYRLRRRLLITFADGSWAAFRPAYGADLEPARRLAGTLDSGAGRLEV